MTVRRFAAPLSALSLALAAGVALAQTAPAPAPPASSPAVAIPSNTCVKPEYPGRFASPPRLATFNQNLIAYSDCVKKYVESTRSIANAAAAAANGAIDDYNKFTNDIKAMDEAAKN
jgi:hypothetical protein